MLRFGVVVLTALWASTPAGAASWADAMFDELSKDFGTVSRGPLLTHAFRFTNRSAAPVHVASVRVSCGCVSAAPSQHDVVPGESAIIHVQMDTRRFNGPKHVTVYVQFARPAWDEVRLAVQAYGRDDIMLTPNELALGKVKRGAPASAGLTISFVGNEHWQIVEVERESNYVIPEVKELRRQGGEVRYELTVRLREDTPVGTWYTDLWLRTNESSTRMRVPLTVQIESSLTQSPAGAAFGQVTVGTNVERKMILRGARPFRIADVVGADEQVSVQAGSAEARPVHVLTIRLQPKEAGDLLRTLRVVTDLQDEGEIEFPVVAQVMPPG